MPTVHILYTWAWREPSCRQRFYWPHINGLLSRSQTPPLARKRSGDFEVKWLVLLLTQEGNSRCANGNTGLQYPWLFSWQLVLSIHSIMVYYVTMLKWHAHYREKAQITLDPFLMRGDIWECHYYRSKSNDAELCFTLPPNCMYVGQ